MHKIGFPGLGIGDFELDPIAFKVFGIDIAWYGIIITLGIAIAVIYGYWRGKREKLIFDDMLDIAFATVIPGIVGARLYYVFFDWLKDPDDYKSFYDVINIRGGGLAIYGGLIFGIIGCIVMLRIKHIRILKLLDCIAPGVMIAQAMGRWGNFFNAEAYGGETTLPWRMRITFGSGVSTEVHPTFFYESLWNVIGFILINTIFYKRKKFDGQIFAIYASWYGLGRMFIEGLRQDSLYAGNIRISQLLAFVFFIAGLVWIIYSLAARKDAVPADCIYYENTAKYNKVMGVESAEESEATEAFSDENSDAASEDVTKENNETSPEDEPEKSADSPLEDVTEENSETTPEDEPEKVEDVPSEAEPQISDGIPPEAEAETSEDTPSEGENEEKKEENTDEQNN